jgi:UDP-N-acetylmuramate--alanine ligase
MRLLQTGTWVYVVGIGGIGMSAIARVLRGWGFRVSGSDRQSSALTQALMAEGIQVFLGHDAQNMRSTAQAASRGILVVASSAVPDENPELVEARRLGYRVVRRREILGELTHDRHTIAVAGTHGKTTTSAMIAWILMQAGLDPTFIVGGILHNLGTNARAGAGAHFVIEADEYDRTFLGLEPDTAVLTTLEHDHPDCYPTFEEMQRAFAEFGRRVSRQGRIIVCGEEPAAHAVAQEAAGSMEEGSKESGSGMRIVTYGVSPAWDWQAGELELGGCPSFMVLRRGRRLGTCAIQLPGRHNVLNALAALAASAEVGVDFGVAAAALTRFRGTERRFEVKGQIGGVTVVDDYAHHPTEIRATLEAARTKYPGSAIWAVFQPHTYSRTKVLLADLAAALAGADHVLVTKIYAARERNSWGVSSADLVSRIGSLAAYPRGGTVPGTGRSLPDAQHVETLQEAVDALVEGVRPGDVVLTLGAGDGYVIGEQLLGRLAQAPGSEAGLRLARGEI